MSSSWYVLYVRSNCEAKTASLIKENLQKHNKLHLLKDLKIPSQKVSMLKKGKKVDVDKKMFPGYVMLHIEEDDSFELMRNVIINTEHVKKFLGAQNKPVPISQEEARTLLKHIEEGKSAQEDKVMFSVGDRVEIRDGGFNGLPGEVEEIDRKSGIVKISVTIFGRSTTVELPFNHIALI